MSAERDTRPFQLGSDGPLPSWARTLVNAARNRNAARGLPSDLFTEDSFRQLWERSGGVCELSGLAFSGLVIGAGRAKRPFWPSLDRIDSQQAYTVDNVRIVTAIANFAMNAWGDLPLKQLSSAVYNKHGKHAAPDAQELTVEGNNEILLDGELLEPDVELMPFPPRADLYPAIRSILESGPVSSDEIAQQLADQFAITEIARSRKMGNGVPAWRNHVAWALVDLLKGRDGEIEGAPSGYRLRGS